VLFHRIDPRFDSRQRAIIHIGAHPVQHARQLLRALQQRVDRLHHVGQQLTL
jgi:hypothetical protein